MSESAIPSEKKTLQTASKSTYKGQRNACSNYAPLERTALRTGSVTKKNQKPKASSHQGQCIPAGYCHSHMPIYESGVNYNVNGKYTNCSVSHNHAAEFLRFGIFPSHISDSCGAIYSRISEMFSALQSASGRPTNTENRLQIDA